MIGIECRDQAQPPDVPVHIEGSSSRSG